jgi:hypothetical protein
LGLEHAAAQPTNDLAFKMLIAFSLQRQDLLMHPERSDHAGDLIMHPQKTRVAFY